MRPRSARAFDDSTSSSDCHSSGSGSGSDLSDSGVSAGSGRERDDGPHRPQRREEEEDVDRLQRLRRIFLSKPSTSTARQQKPRQHQRRRAGRRQRPHVLDTSGSDASERSSSGQSSSDDSRGRRKKASQSQPHGPLTLSVDDHIQVLCDHVRRMSHQHDSTVQQVYEMLQQGIEELKCLKAQEERTLQSQVRVIEESYALRLDLFEQQYRAKVAEIHEEKRRAIQAQREKCEDAILSTARRLHEQTQRALLSELRGGEGGRLVPAPELASPRAPPAPRRCVAREVESVEERRAPPQRPRDGDAAPPRLSPVSRQKAKLRAMEAKLSAFSEDAVRRVTREMETQRRRHLERRGPESRDAERVHPAPSLDDDLADESSVRPTPLSPLRKRQSYWKNGISREAEAPRTDGLQLDQGEQAAGRPPAALNRRFLRADEERELRALRNSIGLAKDWMERHDA
ncbi:hypothetical protein P43SY_004785 [Pythium insidiosum]|uniref:Uncharacterized protein n=1 Tax=Pythium insidiosum TaxID=114742 RepID=A0AAD5M7G4_PYTIN|nr:hypothetical protein P43SY_004785 [Pythium insidiosum]